MIAESHVAKSHQLVRESVVEEWFFGIVKYSLPYGFLVGNRKPEVVFTAVELLDSQLSENVAQLERVARLQFDLETCLKHNGCRAV
jgi:hypothetical protein